MKLFLAAACLATFPMYALAEVRVTDPFEWGRILASRPDAAYLTLLSDAQPSSSRITRSRQTRLSAICPALPFAFSCSSALTSSLVEKKRDL